MVNRTCSVLCVSRLLFPDRGFRFLFNKCMFILCRCTAPVLMKKTFYLPFIDPNTFLVKWCVMFNKRKINIYFRLLCVAIFLLQCQLPVFASSVSKSESAKGEKVIKKYPIFGPKYQNVEIVDSRLHGAIYYLVSGHGGPDPGATSKYNGKLLCEDEYSYDITLRLARELLSHGAMVYMITRDENDGIRDGWHLAADDDEKCYPKLSIPLDHNKRLRQRKDAVNKAYMSNKYKYHYHRMIEIHVDSRSVGEKTDVFFYHGKKSTVGQKFANNMRDTFDKKYKQYQPGRGYRGSVSGRDLYMLKYTHPVALFIELGNICNERDRKRLTMVENRQALAKWLADGCMLDFK